MVKQFDEMGVAIAGGTAGIEKRLGGIDVLVNSIASDVVPEILVRISPETVEQTLAKQAVGSLVAGTEGTDRITAGETFSAKLFARVATMADLGVTEASDQTGLVVYLASPQAAGLTGQAISLNGGISAA